MLYTIAYIAADNSGRALTNGKALRDQYLAFMEEYLSLDHMVEVPKQH